jgi:hypothetical protein
MGVKMNLYYSVALAHDDHNHSSMYGDFAEEPLIATSERETTGGST